MTDELAIEAIGLEKSYGAARVLARVDLQVTRGTVFSLLGPNGAGKTTMVRILSTLTRPDAGQARVAGFDIAGDRHLVRRSISLTGQYATVDLLQTGEENLRMMGRLSGLPRRQARGRARDLLDREYARPLDVPLMARAALMSPSLFSRRFREAYGDTPYGYLQARRVERAMALLRSGHMSVTDVCIAVGFTSLGSFSSTFTRLVGEPPSAYKARDHSRLAPVPPCMTRAWARPGWIAQPCRIGEAFLAGRA